MCGIIGYTGKKKCIKILLDGLKALEYRGYDSSGIALQEAKSIEVVRAVGKVKVLEEKTNMKEYFAATGVAHTRWATHGKPTTANSHPHTDCLGEIVVVHNGIIENYLAFKEELVKKGHKFSSETDTEVIAHLIEEFLKNEKGDDNTRLLSAVEKMLKLIDGSYALAIMWKKLPTTIIGTRKKSPLVVGVGVNETYLGSDVSAFSQHTNKAVYLDDSDIAFINENGICIYDIDGNEKPVNIQEFEVGANIASKNGLEHFMLKEIREQPTTIASTLEPIFYNIEEAFGVKLSEFHDIKNIIIIGCGTAYHAAMVAKYWFEEFTGIPTQTELASEYKYRKEAVVEGSLAIFISQSGETADTVAALEKAKSKGFKTMAICNVYGSTISRICDNTFFTKCGPEISVASTKAFTAQLATLFSLSVLIAKAKKSLSEERIAELIKELKTVAHAVQEVIDNEDVIKNIAEKYYDKKSFIFLGRNVNYPIALEAALKLKEISYLQAEGFAAGEIKHGPIALIEEGMPVVSIMAKDELFDKMMNACEEVMARGATVIAITDKSGRKQVQNKIENYMALSDIPAYLFPIVSVVPFQLFAYWIARLNGREIDQPRNLAKSVTVE